MTVKTLIRTPHLRVCEYLRWHSPTEEGILEASMKLLTTSPSAGLLLLCCAARAYEEFEDVREHRSAQAGSQKRLRSRRNLQATTALLHLGDRGSLSRTRN